MKKWAGLLVLVALPRVLVFPFNQNLGGDAIARTWLAHRWLESPHVIGGFDQGAVQFGPLHIYLLALAEWLWPSLLHAGRAMSLLAALASVPPLFFLTQRLFGATAAKWSTVCFAFWGLHVQCSTTAASESLSLLLVLVVVERFACWVETGERVALLTCALVLNLACATRYDVWLLVPLMVVAAWWRSRSAVIAGVFAVASSAFAVGWMFGNVVDRGDPLYPFRFIDDFHRAWFPTEEATWGRTTYRLICLGFWPGTALATLTPPVAIAGFLGVVRAWRAGIARWLVVLIVVPTVLYTVRSSLLGSFAPLARFTIKEVALLLPFVWFGAQPLLAWRWGKSVVAASAAGVVCWCIGLGAFCFRSTGTWQNSLRPIAATSTLEVRLAALSVELERRASSTATVVLDEDPRGYDDLILSYFSGFSYEHQARRRSPLFETRLRSGPPRVVVIFAGGRLEKESRFHDGSAPTFDSAPLREVAVGSRSIRLYETVD
jgi:hypothetical protein